MQVIIQKPRRELSVCIHSASQMTIQYVKAEAARQRWFLGLQANQQIELMEFGGLGNGNQNERVNLRARLSVIISNT